MNLDSPLVTLPDIALRKVLEQCGYMGIQSLRKTCHDLRSFIDDSSLELDVKSVTIILHPHINSFQYTQGNLEKIRIEYHHEHQSCGITRVDKDVEAQRSLFSKFTLDGLNYLDVFKKDLATFFKTLNGQKAPLEELRFMKRSPPLDETPMEDLTVLKDSLNSGKLLKVLSMFLKGQRESEFLSVLSVVDPKFIKSLHLASSSCCMPLEVDEIAKLEQWKAVRNLIISPQFHVENVRQFMHFRDALIVVKVISREDIAAMLSRFRSSNPPKSFKVGYASRETSGVHGVFEKAPSVRNRSSKFEWYFKNTTTGNVVHVISSAHDIHFKTMKLSSVPSNVLVYE